MPRREESSDYFGDNDSVTKADSMATTHNEPNERSRLLSSSSRGGSVIDLPQQAQSSRSWLSGKGLIYIMIVMVILSAAGDQIMDSPQTRIFESIICYRYYEDADPTKIQVGRGTIGPGALGGVEEAFCKVNAVQEQLAMLRGYQQLFDGFPSLLLALPFGWAADRYGRKPFLTLGLVTIVLRIVWIQLVTWFWQSFDVRMTWLSVLPSCIGGGSTVISGIFFVVLSDITEESERAGVFLRVGAANLLANLIGPPISAWLMQINPWIPNLLGLLVTISTLFALPLVPETLKRHHADPSSRPPTPSAESAPPPPDLSGAKVPITADLAWSARWRGAIKDATSFLTNDWRIIALIIPFFAHMLIAQNTQLLLQYTSKRYSITFSDATLLLTVYNAVKCVLLFFILPWLSIRMVQTLHFSGQLKDLYLSRASQILSMIGFTLIGLSPSVPMVAISMAVTSLGNGGYLMIRSFMTSLVESHHIARLYSIITLVDTIGAMFGGALLAGLFNRGLALGGGWIGLPFLFLGLLSAAFTALLFAVRLRPGEGDGKLADADPDEP